VALASCQCSHLVDLVALRPGALAKRQYHQSASIRVHWQTPESAWTLESQDQLIFSEGAPDEWGEMFGVVQVPEGVGRLVILLGVRGQTGEKDVVWYDDVRLSKLP